MDLDRRLLEGVSHQEDHSSSRGTANAPCADAHIATVLDAVAVAAAIRTIAVTVIASSCSQRPAVSTTESESLPAT